MDLKKLRKEKKLTQKELCEQLGFKSNTYSTWESGKIELPQYARKKISEFFNVDPDNITIEGFQKKPEDMQGVILRKKQNELKVHAEHFETVEINRIADSLTTLLMNIEQLPEPAENPDPYFEKYNQRSALYKVSRIIDLIAENIDTYVVASTMFDKTNFGAISGVYAHLLESVESFHQYMTDYLFSVTKEAIASAPDPEVYTEYIQAFSKHNDVVHKDNPLREAIKEYYAE